MSSNLSSPEHPRSRPPIPPPPGFFEKPDRSLGLIHAMVFGALVMSLVVITMATFCVAFDLRNRYDALLLELRTHIATHQKN
jgi:hypothetical protein